MLRSRSGANTSQRSKTDLGVQGSTTGREDRADRGRPAALRDARVLLVCDGIGRAEGDVRTL